METEKKRRFGPLVFFLVVELLFIVSNPSPKMHLDYIRGTILNEIDTGSSTLNKSINTLAESSIGQDLINNYLSMYFKQTSYLFFSVTEKKVEGEWQVMAIGVLGNIISWKNIKNGIDHIMNKLDL
ncbi:MAG: hypothetical protein Q8N05_03655 [Bacteroidota bacterium]|nr:hypothetical protein [Bacteroidota bacterium]